MDTGGQDGFQRQQVQGSFNKKSMFCQENPHLSGRLGLGRWDNGDGEKAQMVAGVSKQFQKSRHNVPITGRS